jgi:hypothetical protein
LGFDFLRVLRDDERPVHGDGTHRLAEGFLRFSGVSVAHRCTDGHGVRALRELAGSKNEKSFWKYLHVAQYLCKLATTRGHFDLEAN